MAVLSDLLAIEEALAERSAAVLVPITVMIFPFRVSIRSLPSGCLRPRKGITAGRLRLLGLYAIFLESAGFQGFLRARDNLKPASGGSGGNYLPASGNKLAVLTF
jgi:hypothetical protein